MRITYEDVIAKPPEAVFPWIADPEKAMQWQQDVKGGEILVEKPGVVGTTFKETIEEDGQRLELLGTITQYIPDRLIGFHLDSRIHEFDVIYSLDAAGEKTRFRIEADIRWKFPMNVISLFAGRQMATNLIGQLKAETSELKNLCGG